MADTDSRNEVGRGDVATGGEVGRTESVTPAQRKTKIMNRLRRLEGQVRGLQRMVGDERSCQDTLTLLAGIRSALDAAGDLILEDYLETCAPGLQGDKATVDELVKAVKLARG